MVTPGLAEQRAQEPVVLVDDLVDQRRACVEHQRHQRGVAAGRLQVAQVLGGHLAAFAGQLQKAVLVDGVSQAARQREVADGLQPLQVGEQMFRIGRSRRLAQPEKAGDEVSLPGPLAGCQQLVEDIPVTVGQRRSQRLIHLAGAARERFAAHAFDDVDRRHEDALLAQQTDQGFGQDDATVGLPGQLGKVVDEAPVVADGKRRQAQPCLEFRQVFAARLRSLRVLGPDVRLDVQLASDDRQ